MMIMSIVPKPERKLKERYTLKSKNSLVNMIRTLSYRTSLKKYDENLYEIRKLKVCTTTQRHILRISHQYI
jgi:hypothetical protein